MKSTTFKLHDDDSVKEKITVMSKFDAAADDERNNMFEFGVIIEEFLELGKTYRITIEEVDE